MQLQEKFAPVSASLLLERRFEDGIHIDPREMLSIRFYYLATVYLHILYAKHDRNAKLNKRQDLFRNHTSFLFPPIFLSYNFSFGCR